MQADFSMLYDGFMNQSDQSNSAPIVFFDGVCNLCAGSVQFVLKHEKQALLQFSSLQGKNATKILPRYGVDPTEKQSLVVLHNQMIYQQSDAALFIAKGLRFPYRLTVYFSWIPKSIRDAVYRLIARNRYRWFGKKQECWLPDKNLAHRFLE